MQHRSRSTPHLREVVGADALRAVAAANLLLALAGGCGRSAPLLRLKQPRAQHLQRLGLVLVLRAFVLRNVQGAEGMCMEGH
jgi:hypothetical protein